MAKNQMINKTMAKILKGALYVFAQKVYEKATVDDIALKSKVAKGTIYYHFESKGEILLALVKIKLEELSKTIFDEVSRQKEPISKVNS